MGSWKSTNNNKNVSSRWIYGVLEDYAPSTDIFSDEERDIECIKHIIYNELSETDRRVILSYAEMGNLTTTGALFKVSPATIYRKIQQIRDYIISRLPEEAKHKVVTTGRNRQRSEETRRKMSNSHKGNRLSDETKLKMSEALKGNRWKKDPITGKRIYYKEKPQSI